ncbi:MAG: hypothetical protein ABL868_08515 [Sulfuriferula sp.]
MKNTVEVYTEFDYQGVLHIPTTVLDLDAHIKSLDDVSVIPVLLAKANRIDSYSYQYEILLDSQLCYANATGLAADFLVGSDFDFAGFLAVNSVDNVVARLQQIAQDEMGISDFSTHAALKQALLRAYHLDK